MAEKKKAKGIKLAAASLAMAAAAAGGAGGCFVCADASVTKSDRIAILTRIGD